MAPEEAMAHAACQAFLDDMSSVSLNSRERDWFAIDVQTILDETPILHHEINSSTGDALLFLKSSLMFCSPKAGKMQHFPRHLVHCFVDDQRMVEKNGGDVMFRGELFSVTPHEEQLCWTLECGCESEIPTVQRRIARWMAWLNRL